MPELLTEQDYVDAAATIGCEVAVIKAVRAVECPRGGFYANGFPVLLFEPFQFSDLTKGAFDGKTVTIKDTKYPLSINRRKKPWTVANAMYGPSSIQQAKLVAARVLDNDSALEACSWGMAQIMGFNYHMCDYANIQDFVNGMCKSEGDQLNAFVHFIKNSKMDQFLVNKDWVRFAVRYNGNRQDKGTADKTDDYSYFLEKAYKKLCKLV